MEKKWRRIIVIILCAMLMINELNLPAKASGQPETVGEELETEKETALDGAAEGEKESTASEPDSPEAESEFKKEEEDTAEQGSDGDLADKKEEETGDVDPVMEPAGIQMSMDNLPDDLDDDGWVEVSTEAEFKKQFDNQSDDAEIKIELKNNITVTNTSRLRVSKNMTVAIKSEDGNTIKAVSTTSYPYLFYIETANPQFILNNVTIEGTAFYFASGSYGLTLQGSGGAAIKNGTPGIYARPDTSNGNFNINISGMIFEGNTGTEFQASAHSSSSSNDYTTDTHGGAIAMGAGKLSISDSIFKGDRKSVV